METYQLNEIKRVENCEGQLIEIDELYVDEDPRFLKAESKDDVYYIPISGYNEQAGFIGEIHWEAIQKESDLLNKYKEGI